LFYYVKTKPHNFTVITVIIIRFTIKISVCGSDDTVFDDSSIDGYAYKLITE
jgi:hypothetical protein